MREQDSESEAGSFACSCVDTARGIFLRLVPRSELRLNPNPFLPSFLPSLPPPPQSVCLSFCLSSYICIHNIILKKIGPFKVAAGELLSLVGGELKKQRLVQRVQPSLLLELSAAVETWLPTLKKIYLPLLIFFHDVNYTSDTTGLQIVLVAWEKEKGDIKGVVLCVFRALNFHYVSLKWFFCMLYICLSFLFWPRYPKYFGFIARRIALCAKKIGLQETTTKKKQKRIFFSKLVAAFNSWSNCPHLQSQSGYQNEQRKTQEEYNSKEIRKWLYRIVYL